MNRKLCLVPALLAATMLVTTAMTTAVAGDKPVQVLITNVDVWDGRSDTVKKEHDVLIEGNLVKQVALAHAIWVVIFYLLGVDF